MILIQKLLIIVMAYRKLLAYKEQNYLGLWPLYMGCSIPDSDQMAEMISAISFLFATI